MQEIKRLLIALQTADTHKVATPANWTPGEEVIVPAPGSCGAARERMTDSDPTIRCVDWFLCFKGLPRD
jgi:peroxiredoxin (alkyl hydroperoxide reductase subunit C)